MATASSEQPLKKRRLFEPPPVQSEHSLGSSAKPENLVPPPATPSPPPPPSQEEILAKKRNRDEIRSVYENYRRIKSCIARRDKDGRHLSELEQAYLALITASGGQGFKFFFLLSDTCKDEYVSRTSVVRIFAN